jgi:peroxiredoxin Q/BCP
LVELHDNLDAIAATNTQVVGISYDSVETLQKFAKSSGVEFPLLADPGSATIRAYGIHNEKGLPHPGTYIIGADRKVLAALFQEGFRKRHTVDDLIKTIRELAP